MGLGGDASTALLVSSVKLEALQPIISAQPSSETVDCDKDMCCPIRMQIIKDAFLTACGNFFTLLNSSEILKRTSAIQIANGISPVEHLHQALEQGCEVSRKEIDELPYLLTEKKRKMEQEEAESTNVHILLDFLCSLRQKKLEEFDEIQTDLQCIMEDIEAIERRRMALNRERDIYSSKPKMLGGDPNSKPAIRSGLTLARKDKIHEQFDVLQEYYFQNRRCWARLAPKLEEKDKSVISRDAYSTGLEDFESVLTNFTRYRQLRVIAELRHADIFHSANIVSSIEFDRDDQLFATAGVSRRIKVFDFFSVLNEPTDIHCPIAEMHTRSKLSCLSWNKYMKNQIASSDYEGIVTLWDANTHQSIIEYEEHDKRTWSVDFSRTEPSMLASGGDDCKVKIWCTKQETSVLSIDMKANICSVKYNPGSSIFVAVGSADHHIHYYDLRNISQELYVFKGHRKAVSYVKFLSTNELASASTDSTLRLWNVKDNMLLQTFRGHANEKNFVGLTVNSEYLACGSETNEVFVYHKAISKPAARHRFVSDSENADNDAGAHFVSSVCWKRDSSTMLTANSQGMILKCLYLLPEWLNFCRFIDLKLLATAYIFKHENS